MYQCHSEYWVGQSGTNALQRLFSKGSLGCQLSLYDWFVQRPEKFCPKLLNLWTFQKDLHAVANRLDRNVQKKKSYQRALLRLQRQIRAAGAPCAGLRTRRLENHKRQTGLQFEVQWQLQVVSQLKGLDDVKVPQRHLAEQERDEDGATTKLPQRLPLARTSVSDSSLCRSPAEA